MRKALVLLLVLASCNGEKASSGNAPGDPAGAQQGGDPLNGDDAQAGDPGGCLPNQVRDGHGDCVTVCERNEDCDDPALACNTVLGLCVEATNPGCDPANCQTGFVCPEAGSESTDCVPLPGYCLENGDCSLTQRCSEAHTCISRVGDVIMTCSDEQPCQGLLLTCQAGVCVGCVDDLQCGEGNKCVLGACVVAELGPAGDCINLQCPEGERCNVATGQCTKTCTVNEDCDEGQSCLPVANQCVAEYGCETTDDCTVPLQCVAGLCVGCTSDDQCRSSEKCSVGACFPRLDASPCDDVTCEENELCDARDGSCYPANGTCVDASDCRPGHTCNFLHLCAGCSVEGDCRPGQRCVLSTCVPLE